MRPAHGVVLDGSNGAAGISKKNEEQASEGQLDIEEMFRIACGRTDRDCWGLAPSEFWNLCPQEWWWLFEANVGPGVKAEVETKERLKRLYLAAKEKEHRP